MSDNGFWGGFTVAAIVGALAWFNKEAPSRPVLDEKVACFEFYDRKGENPVMADKCTGKTYMLVKSAIEKDPKNPTKDTFTYMWYELTRGYGQLELQLGIADERYGR